MEKTKLLILRITDRCNLNCRYCYAASGGGDMSPETAVRAIDLLAKPGDKLKIQFTGGEPLLCPELMEEVFRYTNRQGIQASFSIQTNGTLLTRENCALLKKMRCGVGVSLDGMGDANGLRCYGNGRPAFEDTVKGIRNLAMQGIRCNINAVVSRQNQARLEELPELAAYLQNVRGIGLDMFRPIGRGAAEDFSPDLGKLPGDLRRLLDKQKQLEALGVKVKIKELEKTRTLLGCSVRESCYCYAQTDRSFAVDPAGDIYPCSSFVGMEDMKLGNVANGAFVGCGSCPAENTSTEKALSDTADLRSGVPCMDESCIACEHAPICRGGCPAGRKACGGKNEADCLMHKTVIEYAKSEENLR